MHMHVRLDDGSPSHHPKRATSPSRAPPASPQDFFACVRGLEPRATYHDDVVISMFLQDVRGVTIYRIGGSPWEVASKTFPDVRHGGPAPSARRAPMHAHRTAPPIMAHSCTHAYPRALLARARAVDAGRAYLH